MKKSRIIVAIGFLTMACSAFGANWTNWRDLASNFYYDSNIGGIMALTTTSDFHSCGANEWGNIKESVVGLDSFKMLNAALLSAWISNRQVSLLVDGCDGGRAKIIGIRIGD